MNEGKKGEKKVNERLNKANERRRKETKGGMKRKRLQRGKNVWKKKGREGIEDRIPDAWRRECGREKEREGEEGGVRG